MAKFKPRHHTPQPPRTEHVQDAPDFAQSAPTRADLPPQVSAEGRKFLDAYRALYASFPADAAKDAHMREFARRFCEAAKLDVAHAPTIIAYLTTPTA